MPRSSQTICEKGGLLARITYRFKRARQSDTIGLRLASEILHVRPHAQGLHYYEDGSIANLRKVFIAYMNGGLSEDDCRRIEGYLRQPDRIRDRSHWDAIGEQFSDELLELAVQNIPPIPADPTAESNMSEEYPDLGSPTIPDLYQDHNQEQEQLPEQNIY